MDTAALFWGLLFSSIRLGYFIYGKRQQAPVPLACGIALMVLPYVVSGPWTLVRVGGALMAALLRAPVTIDGPRNKKGCPGSPLLFR